ncbi:MULTISPECIES: hypothetical protein [Brucella]|uniref:Uncharacterized protein n=1 Tax=Ochrobactrum soli TaxID=2448455 RepID=A0A2P9HBN6_9HYPH|nr:MULTISPECIES: hypothetical protein [Brucella]MCI1002255.1 hypothetical protein [Ochrobactrum sp. C6C9]MDX4072059.1 hypothetical protein [Brucella sp. NBRC 113783]SPL61496.1 hypothetical protein OHAE_4288 [[Ochrobactrum] soli]
MAYVTAEIRASKVYHGYDEDRKAVIDDLGAGGFVTKLIKVSRILSVTEDYIFIECPHNTVQTWEYKGTLEDFRLKLRQAGVAAE